MYKNVENENNMRIRTGAQQPSQFTFEKLHTIYISSLLWAWGPYYSFWEQA